MLDQVVLVNEDDQQIGVMDKVAAHRGNGQLHRAASVFLFHDGKCLIQQRSAKKIVGAEQWANTCCGNVRPGESYEECARRRLKEELGIQNVALQQRDKFLYQTPCNEEFSENEIDVVFVGEYVGDVQPNADEVSAFRWMDVNALIKEVANDNGVQKKFVPWLHIMLFDKKIQFIPTHKNTRKDV